MTVFIKRYPSKGEFPKEDGIIVMTTNERLLYNQTFGWVNLQNYTTKAPDYWLEEIELPSEEEMQSEIYHESMEAEHAYDFQQGAKHMQNFILNHLKSNTNETDKI